MTKSEALRRVNQAQREAAAGAIKHGYPSEEMGPFQQQKFSEAILTAVAEERERWIKLAPWWTGRALQSPEDIRRLAVAEERDRCAAVVKSYQSPRSGILLARQPGVVIAQILEEIEVPGWQLEPPEKTELET
jgi:hypothetical protein